MRLYSIDVSENSMLRKYTSNIHEGDENERFHNIVVTVKQINKLTLLLQRVPDPLPPTLLQGNHP